MCRSDDISSDKKTRSATWSLTRTLRRLALFAAAVALAARSLPSMDILNGMTSSTLIGKTQMQLSLLGFCASPFVSRIEAELEREKQASTAFGQYSAGENQTWAKDGHMAEDSYMKESIYAVLYSLYQNAGKVVSDLGVEYEFTFNTWGITTDWGAAKIATNDPQRFGKASYGYFQNFPTVQQYLERIGGNVSMVEFGCGTGAGAHHVSTTVFPKATYTAVDMQGAAIATCNRLHAHERLSCMHVPEGVGNVALDDRIPSNSMDFLLVMETHIAEKEIGADEKRIFAEVMRVLKPGGLFLWGNALPTHVWIEAERYLTEEAGFAEVERANNTALGVEARDQDAARVDVLVDQLFGDFVAFKAPVIGASCEQAVRKMLLNFYRHPGHTLYNRMVHNTDSYMHLVFQKPQ
jgi:SAM-dependent methyltransferase